MKYTEIADLAAGLSVDDAFVAISSRTTEKQKPIDQRMINERTILGLIGMSAGGAFMSAIEASPDIPARVKSWFKPSESGVDVLNGGTQYIIANLVAGGVITQDQADSITAFGIETVPEFGGITRGHVQKAVDMRARGEI